MRASHIITKARHYGSRAYDMARMAGGHLNHIIDTSARVYGGIVQPMLNAHGVDTRDTDMALSGMYQQYNSARDSASYFDSLIKA